MMNYANKSKIQKILNPYGGSGCVGMVRDPFGGTEQHQVYACNFCNKNDCTLDNGCEIYNGYCVEADLSNNNCDCTNSNNKYECCGEGDLSCNTSDGCPNGCYENAGGECSPSLIYDNPNETKCGSESFPEKGCYRWDQQDNTCEYLGQTINPACKYNSCSDCFNKNEDEPEPKIKVSKSSSDNSLSKLNNNILFFVLIIIIVIFIILLGITFMRKKV